MMNKVLVLIFGIVFITACKKDNELNDVSLANSYDGEVVDFITLDNVNPISCDYFRADFKINTEKIPSELDYTHVVLKYEDGTTIKYRVLTGLFFESNCTGTTTYLMTLYNEDSKLESRPSKYIYTP